VTYVIQKPKSELVQINHTGIYFPLQNLGECRDIITTTMTKRVHRQLLWKTCLATSSATVLSLDSNSSMYLRWPSQISRSFCNVCSTVLSWDSTSHRRKSALRQLMQRRPTASYNNNTQIQPASYNNNTHTDTDRANTHTDTHTQSLLPTTTHTQRHTDTACFLQQQHTHRQTYTDTACPVHHIIPITALAFCSI